MFSDTNNPQKQPTLVKDMLKHARDYVFNDSSNISCEFNIEENLWLVNTDVHQINQVFVEILNNAKEAMTNGGQLTVTAKNFKKQDLANIYDPYFSLKPRGAKRGMGLGLALVAAIISQHEGKVHISSVPEEGTTVEIRLPAMDQLPG